MNHKARHLMGLILIICLFAACTPLQTAAMPTPYEIKPTYIPPPVQEYIAGTPDIILVTQAPLPVRSPDEYPRDPEGVVSAFLDDYQSDPDGLTAYLSEGLSQAVPDGGPGMLLRFRDFVEGFGLTNVAVNQNPPYAIITVTVKIAGTADTSRIFKLTKENERWVITDILLPEN